MEEQNTATQAMQEQQQKRSKKKGCLIGGLIVFAVILIIGMFASMCDNDSTSDNGTTSSKAPSAEREAVKDSVTWEITTKIDEMTDSKNIWAEIRSDNYINQDIPYEGDTYAHITIRYMKKDGFNVMISIDQGQIYSANEYLTVRFDQGDAKKYYYSWPADGRTDYVFLSNSKDFIAQCKKAHDIKMQIPMFNQGGEVFNFHVDKPLVWPED